MERIGRDRSMGVWEKRGGRKTCTYPGRKEEKAKEVCICQLVRFLLFNIHEMEKLPLPAPDPMESCSRELLTNYCN